MNNRPQLLHFGAGNIGRSLVGQLFSKAGYDVVFVDADRRIVDALNETELGGRTLTVNEAKPQAPRTGGFGGGNRGGGRGGENRW